MGSELFTKDGRTILDFLSGYCVHNTGHNHPYIVQALKDEMENSGPAMLQSHMPEVVLATLDVLERDKLGPRTLQLGEQFRAMLRQTLAPFEMVKEVRGLGLLCGIEFRAPKKLSMRVAFEAFHRIHPAMFVQIVVMRMFREKNILTQICGNNFMVLKAAPPLVVTEQQLDEFVRAIRDVVELAHTSATFWSEALGLARRAVNI